MSIPARYQRMQKIDKSPQQAIDICRDLYACCNDDKDRKLALESAKSLCLLSMQTPVVRVGFVARFRHRPNGVPQLFLQHLSDDEKALLSDLEKLVIIDILHEKKEQNIESLRQMLLAIANDARVVVVKLALQLTAMRHLSFFDESKQQQLALQTRDIFAPLANRLGIAKFKWELEDLALKKLKPAIYQLIASSLAEQRREREVYVNQVVNTLRYAIENEGIANPEIYGRAKHINSIFNKMKKKNKRLEEIYDLLAIRIEVETLKDCYSALGVVHAMWNHIPSEFDDYIANPKPNGYQSLHTAIVGPQKRTIEIQIRTRQMHAYAELGVAAHWRYKENPGAKTSTFDKQIQWLRALLNESDEAIIDEFAAQITEDRVYAITPQGKVIDLPNGSTPLDFAYYIHTDLGHRTRGARINGNLVPITYHLKTGDTVEILTHRNLQPSRDWLNPNPHAGYLKSSKARAKVRHFFKRLERNKAINEGEALLNNTLNNKHIHPSHKHLQQIAEKINCNSVEDLYAALGFGDISIVSINRHLENLIDDKDIDLSDIAARLARIPIKPSRRKKGNVTIEDIDDLLISMASCCNPVAPEKITGFITRTKGVRIHRSNCANLQALKKSQPDKIIAVNWALGEMGFATTIQINAIDRAGLIREAAQAVINEGATIQKANAGRNNDANLYMQLQITVRDTQHLDQVLNKTRQVKNVQTAFRVESTI